MQSHKEVTYSTVYINTENVGACPHSKTNAVIHNPIQMHSSTRKPIWRILKYVEKELKEYKKYIGTTFFWE